MEQASVMCASLRNFVSVSPSPSLYSCAIPNGPVLKWNLPGRKDGKFHTVEISENRGEQHRADDTVERGTMGAKLRKKEPSLVQQS